MPEKGRNIMLTNDTGISIIKRLFYYGCYSEKDALELEGLKRFDRYKNFLQYAFGDHLEEITLETSGEKALHFRTDEFEMPFNILLDIYTMTNISSTEFILFLKLMNFFTGKNQKKQFTSVQIYTNIDVINSGKYVSDRTFQRKLQELADYGYLTSEGKGKFLYSKPESILNALDESSIYRLTALTDFCRNIYHPAVCGHYLMDTLSVINQQKSISYDTLFLCKHLHMGQVLEDEKLWKLLTAIHEKKTISLHYKGILYQHLQPHKIIINETDGRRYVFCIILENGRNGGILYRLGNILEITIEKKKKEIPLTLISEEEADKIYHDLLDKSFTGKCPLRKKLQTGILIYKKDFYYEIQKHFPEATPEPEDEFHDKIHIEVNSLTEMKPWLRKNLGKVRLTDTSDGTAEELEQELKEWRAMYGIGGN